MNEATKKFSQKTKLIIQEHEKRISERNAEFDAKYPSQYMIKFHSFAREHFLSNPMPNNILPFTNWLSENMDDDAWAYDATRRLFGFVDNDDRIAFITKFADLV